MPRPSYELAHCIVCGHADTETVADDEAMQRERETLWAYHQRRLRAETPPPRLIDRVAFSEHPPLRLVRCRECGLVYRNPVERPRDLAELYEDAPSPEVLRTLHESQRPAMRTQVRAVRAAARRGRGLEIGSYAGAFLGAARDEGLAFEGLDINPQVNAFVRSLGFTVHDGELSSFDAGGDFAVVAIWNVFDQLADPRGTLADVRRVLAPEGQLAIRVPNGGFYETWRRRLALGGPVWRSIARSLLAQNNLLTFPYRWGFTPSSLVRLLTSCGFDTVAVRGDTLVRTADDWTRRWARVEEMLIKGLSAGPARLATRWAPWFEVYARRG
ncbi:MAG TPA: methyltransferase domain-containing protein [Gemmatimonadaceae bacterium]